jgi:hypothetical protein
MESASIIPLNILARRLRVPVGWLRDEARAGRVPCIQAGRQILVNPAAVETALLARAAANPQSADGRRDDGR